MSKLLSIFAGIFISFCFLACNEKQHEDTAEACVDSFAVNYYNYALERSLRYVTEDSQVWIKFVASNMTETDIDLLRSMHEGASVEVNGIEETEDGRALASLTVRNYLKPGRFGSHSSIVEAGKVEIPLIRVDGKWKVMLTEVPRMEVQQQSGTPDHDAATDEAEADAPEL